MGEEELDQIVFAPDLGYQGVCGDEDGPRSAHRLGYECGSPVAWLSRGRDAVQEECATGGSNAGHKSHAWSLGERYSWLPQHHSACKVKRGLQAAHGSEQPFHLLGRKVTGWMDLSSEPHPTTQQALICSAVFETNLPFSS